MGGARKQRRVVASVQEGSPVSSVDFQNGVPLELEPYVDRNIPRCVPDRLMSAVEMANKPKTSMKDMCTNYRDAAGNPKPLLHVVGGRIFNEKEFLAKQNELVSNVSKVDDELSETKRPKRKVLDGLGGINMDRIDLEQLSADLGMMNLKETGIYGAVGAAGGFLIPLAMEYIPDTNNYVKMAKIAAPALILGGIGLFVGRKRPEIGIALVSSGLTLTGAMLHNKLMGGGDGLNISMASKAVKGADAIAVGGSTSKPAVTSPQTPAVDKPEEMTGLFGFSNVDDDFFASESYEDNFKLNAGDVVLPDSINGVVTNPFEGVLVPGFEGVGSWIS